MKKFKTKYGYFTEDGKEFVITNPFTPKPWVNVISNGNYGLVISQLNGGFSWIGNSNLSRLTRWHQDLIQDNWGKYIFLRDEKNGKYWSPTIQPVSNQLEEYECRHGIGYTTFHSLYNDIQTELRIFVSFEDDLEIWTLTLQNKASQTKKIGIYTYFEWCLGAAPDNHREFHKTFIETKFDEKEEIFLAKKRLWEVAAERGHWNIDWPLTAYFACSEKIDGFEGDKETFIGNYRSLSQPLALETGILSGKQGKWNDSIASLKKIVSLKPKQQIMIHFILGAGKDSHKAVNLVNKYRSENAIESAFKSVSENWEAFLNATTIESPDEALNFMSNTWLKYQAISGRIWARTAYYQQSGAYGFRDQLQDSQIFLYSHPELTKKQILLHARHQFKAGHVLHWWHPLSDQGLETNITDDLLWLPFVVVQYLKETGDWSILDENVPYYDKAQSDTLLEHCFAAIDLVLSRFSERGLPLILAGDWNDGLSAVGLEGKGESIWLGHFLFYVLKEMIFVLKRISLEEKVEQYQNRAESLKTAINEYGWDGQWYWRASKDNGELIGSHVNEEGKIFLNAQIWSVIAGTGHNTRQELAMKAVEEMLECDAGMLLLYPAYSQPDPYIGYLSRYAPGVRENGGVYIHAATWTIWAANIMDNTDLAYRIYKKLCPIYNGQNADRYAAEPFVTPGNIDGPDSPHYGRGGWTWYTGSASWLFRVTIDYLIGIQADYDGLIVKPCFPFEWKKVSVKRLFRGTTYNIKIQNIKNEMKNSIEIFIEGKKIEGNKIPIITGQKEVQVMVKRKVF